jgi:MYXO-CTERM domain-containing protein
LGTVYYGTLERVEVAVDTTDEVVITGPGIVDLGDDRWDVPAGVTMAVTATGSAGASWTLTVTEPAGGEDTGDTGTDEDSGDNGTDEDTGGDGKGDGGKGGTNGPPAEEPGCGCTTTPAASVPLLAGVAGLALLRRRRGIVDLRACTAHSR